MLRGMSTISFWAEDHAAAKAWYSELLGIQPYFDMPGYFEFRIGDYQHELGVVDSRYAPAGYSKQTGGTITYWHVDDLEASLERLLALGATLHQPITDRSEGFLTASVLDPFGNILGIMSNPHYLAILEEAR